MAAVIARARVLYNFIAEDSSQLSMAAGQMISIFDKDESGWWDGMNEDTGERGLFPSTYVEEIWDYQIAPNEDHGIGYAQVDPSAGVWTGAGDPASAAGGAYLGAGGPETASTTLLGAKEERPKDSGEKKGGRSKKEGGGEKEDDSKKTVTRWGTWARNMAQLNNFATFGVGIFNLVSVFEGRNYNFRFELYMIIIFFIAVGVGAAGFIFESFTKGMTPGGAKFRAVLYTLFGIPMCVTLYTVFQGVLYFIAVGVFVKSFSKGEIIKAPPKEEHKSAKKSYNCIANTSKSGQWGKVAFVTLFAAGNILALVLTYIDWYGRYRNRRIPRLGTARAVYDSMFPFTQYLPTARAGGTGLNIAFTFILYPVARTFLRKLYDLSTQNETCFSRSLRTILWLFPLDKAIHFHEKVAYLGLIYAFMHSFAHLVNASLTWDNVVAFYGWSPLISGFCLWLIMYFLYPATLKNVKFGHFEIFWYTHQLFFGFFALLIIHGRNTIGPNYWRYFILPGFLYTVERIYRAYSAYQTVPLVSVTNMFDKVYAIEFDKSAFPNGYKEGQYVFLQAPYVSTGQWHPFTISSAPGDDTVTLHIKVLGSKSWTKKVLDYLTLLGPRGATYFELTETAPNGARVGKTTGPSGERILRLYGPHAAPTEHAPEYPVDIIVGSGIGVTPVASTMQQISYHRWKFNIGQSFPDHVYFCWVCSYTDIEYFRWMIRIIKEAQEQINDLRSKNPDYMGGKTFEVHIWVTSVPEDAKTPDYVDVKDEDGFWGRARKKVGNVVRAPAVFDELDLYKTMIAPPKGAPALLGDVRVYNGRPKWDLIFQMVTDRHPASKCGVAFCGNPRIAKDLKVMCTNYTNLKAQQYFVLHKENF
jgi:NAD(P)H-flavin reductase